MLTTNDLVKQTRPRDNGADDGVHDRPPTNAASYTTETEQTIQSLCEEEASAAENLLIKTIKKSRTEISTIRNSLPQDISNKADTLRTALRGALVERAGDISDAADQVETRAKDLRRFKILNELNYEPHYDDSLVNLFGTAVLAVAIESAINAWFFGKASDAGLVGGFFTAAMISLANVAFGFLTGVWPFRQMNHVKKWRLIWAVPVGFFLVVGAVVFNLIVGHYRERLIKEPDKDFIDVIPDALNNLFGIRSFDSMILILVGLLIFGMSLYKGYKVWDTYPGYMLRHRAKRDADEQFKAERDRIARDVDRQLGHDLVDFNGIGPSIKIKRSRLDELAQTIDAEVTSFENKIQQVEQAGNFAMKIYRDANQQVRSRRSPPPTYFQMDFKIDSTSELAEVQEARRELSSALEQLTNAEKSLQTANTELANERTAVLDQLEDAVLTAEKSAKTRAAAEREAEKSERDKVRAT